MTSPTPNSPRSESAAHPHWWSRLQELLDARLAMAKLEVRHNIHSFRRLGIAGTIGAVVALSGLPVLLIVLSQALAARTRLDVFTWQFLLGGAFSLAGMLILLLAWRSFRRNFTGLAETLDELREDRRWLEEIAGELIGAAPLTAQPGESADESPPGRQDSQR